MVIPEDVRLPFSPPLSGAAGFGLISPASVGLNASLIMPENFNRRVSSPAPSFMIANRYSRCAAYSVLFANNIAASLWTSSSCRASKS